ncbi:MAG: hypothetical protein PHH31_04810 [Acidaminococcaceae bacterium]|nr:hypothetical protein [Acidaminococcaceae bacterium]
MKAKYYLINLLMVLLGVLLFLINAKKIVQIPGLFLISILLMVLPALLAIFVHQKLNLIQILSLVFIPITMLNYMYYIQMGVPVGFTDPHYHIFQFVKLFDDSGKIIFEKAQSISFNFVGLYIVFQFLSKIIGSDIVYLATIIPPFLNLLIIITVFMIVSKLVGYKVGLLSTIFYGWENQVLIFGQEFRSQTIGVFILFIILFMLFNQKKETNTVSRLIALMILMAGLITTSFAVNIYALIALFIIILLPLFLKITGQEVNNTLLTTGTFTLFIILFIFYMIYISNGFDTSITAVCQLFIDAFLKAQTSPTLNVGQVIYNNFIKGITYILWFLFILCYIYYFKKIIEKREFNTPYVIFFIVFSGLFAFFIINSLVGPLSSGRIYALIFIFIAAVVSCGLYNLWDSSRVPIKKPITMLIISFIICFISASTAKMPSYIIGDASPIRASAGIDNVMYWSRDDGQYFVGNFMQLYSANSTLYPYLIIKNHSFLSSCEKGKLKIASTKEQSYIANSYLVLKDKHNNKPYFGRNSLPSFNDLDNHRFPLIYTNNDFILWYVSVS